MSQKRIFPRLIISGIILFSLGLAMYIATLEYFEPDVNTKASLVFAALGFCATLYAPVAAFILYDSWKSQTKFNRVTHNIIELQKTLHEYVSALRLLRQRIIFPYSRKKFNNDEEEYRDNLKRLFDQKVCEINAAHKFRYEAFKILNITKTDTYIQANLLEQLYHDLNQLIDDIHQELDQFNKTYCIFIKSYYKEENDLRAYLKSEDYKKLTYQLSINREFDNLYKTKQQLPISLSTNPTQPIFSRNIDTFIERTDILCKRLLETYEKIS